MTLYINSFKYLFPTRDDIFWKEDTVFANHAEAYVLHLFFDLI